MKKMSTIILKIFYYYIKYTKIITNAVLHTATLSESPEPAYISG